MDTTQAEPRRPEAAPQGQPDVAADPPPTPATEAVAEVVQAAAEAAELRQDEAVFGAPGRPMNRRSPFSIGLFGAAGVGVAYLLARMLVDASSVLVLIGLALFLAIGLDPAVQWLTRRRLPRWAAVAIVALVVLGSVGGFLAAAVPPLIAQGTQFAHELPGYLGQLRDHSTTLGRLDARFHLKDRLDTAVLTSLIAGVGTFIWLVTFHVPYPILLAIAVAILDLIPVVGSTIGGILVSLIALTVSLPVAIATLAFYVAYRLAEDYLIVPKIIGRTVQVTATTTLLAVLIGGAVLGFVGALIAIPVAAAIGILLRERRATHVEAIRRAALSSDHVEHRPERVRSASVGEQAVQPGGPPQRPRPARVRGRTPHPRAGLLERARTPAQDQSSALEPVGWVQRCARSASAA